MSAASQKNNGFNGLELIYLKTHPEESIMDRVYRKPAAQRDLFSTDRTFLERAKKGAGVLLTLDKLFDFESYREAITEAVEAYRLTHGGKASGQLSRAGRRPMDPVFMFKCIFAQRLFGKADKDFMQEMFQNIVLQDWLGINYPSDVPSHKTIWKYKEIFAKTEILEQIFESYVKKMQALNSHIGTKAVIVDSSFVEAPKQRNTREENAVIKEGKGDTLWNDQPRKKRHKDVDASWTKKREEVHYGYKGHFLVCAISKLIMSVFPTTAKVHDAKVVDKYLHWGKDKQKGELLFFADAGYVGKAIEEKLRKANFVPMICQKGKKNAPLSEEQKQGNKTISSIRCRIEHVFGFIEESLGGSIVRSVGMTRAKFNITLTSLVYNVCRFAQIVRETARKQARKEQNKTANRVSLSPPICQA